MGGLVGEVRRDRGRMVLVFTVVGAVLILAVYVMVAVWAHAAREERDARLADAAFYDRIVESEQAYVLDVQVENGAFLYAQVRDGSARVIPYFSSLGALGLLEGGSAETEYERFSAVEDYLAWYGNHLESGVDSDRPKGSIADYDLDLSDGKIVGETPADPDSVDSYAAVYVIVLSAYYNAGGDASFLREHADDARIVINTLLGTISANGLSCVSPENDTNYLMDNAEVLAALHAVPSLVEQVWLPVSSPYEVEEWSDLSWCCEAAATTLEQAVSETLWDADAACYFVGVDASSGNEISWKGWDDFYPSAVAQVAPAAWADGFAADALDHSRALYDEFCAAWAWEDFEHVDEGAASFYWGMLAYAAASLGDEERARTYLEEYSGRVKESDHGWPLYIADASWASRTAALLADKARDDAAGMDPFGLLDLIP